jgi:hypothetical protein
MRYSVAIDSAAGLGSGSAIVALVPDNQRAICVRKLIIGGRGTTTQQNVTVGGSYIGGAGAAGTSVSDLAIGPKQFYISAFPGYAKLESSFSIDPAFSAQPLFETSFSTTSDGQTLKWGREKFGVPYIASGNNGLALVNLGAAVPAGFLFTVTFEYEVF